MFRFSADHPDATFKCKVDDRKFQKCKHKMCTLYYASVTNNSHQNNFNVKINSHAYKHSKCKISDHCLIITN